MTRTLLIIAFILAVIGTLLSLGKLLTNITIKYPRLELIIDLLAAVFCSASGVIAVMGILSAI